MPTIGHVAIGFAAARAHARGGDDLTKQMVLFGGLAVLPDLDLLATSVARLGHRGATHSLFAAAVLALFVGLVGPRASRVRTTIVAFLVVASHGLIDPLNTNSIGTAYFWPFSSARLTWGSFHPIPITPVGLEMLHGIGLHHLITETLLFSPFLIYAFCPRIQRIRATGTTGQEEPTDETYVKLRDESAGSIS